MTLRNNVTSYVVNDVQPEETKVREEIEEEQLESERMPSHALFRGRKHLGCPDAAILVTWIAQKIDIACVCLAALR